MINKIRPSEHIIKVGIVKLVVRGYVFVVAVAIVCVSQINLAKFNHLQMFFSTRRGSD
jgi:hypothetical protein